MPPRTRSMSYVSARAPEWRGGPAVGRDYGVGVDRPGSGQTLALRAAERLGRPGDSPKGGRIPVCADDGSSDRGPSEASTSAGPTGAVSRQRQAVYRRHRRGRGRPSGTTRRPCRAMVRIVYGTRSVRISRCGARRRGRFRSWPGMPTSRRRSGTCTSVLPALDGAIRFARVPRNLRRSWQTSWQRRTGADREPQLCQHLVAEKGGSRTLRGPDGPQTGFEDQRHHRAPSFSPECRVQRGLVPTFHRRSCPPHLPHLPRLP